MAIVPWLGPSYYSNQSTTVAGGTPWVNIGGDGPGSVMNLSPPQPISLKDYPFCDPMFQNFTAQQYVFVGTAGPAGTYSEKAPEVAAEPHVETDDERKARLRAELHTLATKKNPTAKDKARMTVVEAAIKNGHKE